MWAASCVQRAATGEQISAWMSTHVVGVFECVKMGCAHVESVNRKEDEKNQTKQSTHKNKGQGGRHTYQQTFTYTQKHTVAPVRSLSDDGALHLTISSPAMDGVSSQLACTSYHCIYSCSQTCMLTSIRMHSRFLITACMHMTESMKEWGAPHTIKRSSSCPHFYSDYFLLFVGESRTWSSIIFPSDTRRRGYEAVRIF